MNFHITFPNKHCLESTLIYLITPCKYFIIFQWNVSKTITLCCLWSGEGVGLGGKWGDLPLQLLSAEASPSLDIRIFLPPLQGLSPYREVSLQEKCFLPKTNWGHVGQIRASQEENGPLLNSNSLLPYSSSHRPWSLLPSWTSDLCGQTGPHAQRALCSVLCLMVAITVLKFLDVFLLIYFSWLWVIFSCFLECLLIYDQMPQILLSKFYMSGAGFCCISLNSVVLCSGTQLSCLE